MIVWKGFPGRSVRTVVFSYRPPRPFAEVRSPAFPMLFSSRVLVKALPFGSVRRSRMNGGRICFFHTTSGKVPLRADLPHHALADHQNQAGSVEKNLRSVLLRLFKFLNLVPSVRSARGKTCDLSETVFSERTETLNIPWGD